MHLARTSGPAIPTTILLSLEWEYMWRGGGKGTWGGVAMGERRGCLIYWFHSCRCSSLLLSVREGKWSVQAGWGGAPNPIFSQLSRWRAYMSISCTVFQSSSVLPFPHCLSFAHQATCSLCLVQPCKQERPLGLALIWSNLRAPLTCGCLFRMPRTT